MRCIVAGSILPCSICCDISPIVTEATADIHFALLLAVARRVVEGDQLVRAGIFPGAQSAHLLGAWVHGRTIGLIGGGGLKGGQVVGSTDRLGERPKGRPLTPNDLHQTIYHVLGVDPTTNFLDHSGRPIPAVDGGEPIRELI